MSKNFKVMVRYWDCRVDTSMYNLNFGQKLTLPLEALPERVHMVVRIHQSLAIKRTAIPPDDASFALNDSPPVTSISSITIA